MCIVTNETLCSCEWRVKCVPLFRNWILLPLMRLYYTKRCHFRRFRCVLSFLWVECHFWLLLLSLLLFIINDYQGHWAICDLWVTTAWSPQMIVKLDWVVVCIQNNSNCLDYSSFHCAHNISIAISWHLSSENTSKFNRTNFQSHVGLRFEHFRMTCLKIVPHIMKIVGKSKTTRTIESIKSISYKYKIALNIFIWMLLLLVSCD